MYYNLSGDIMKKTLLFLLILLLLITGCKKEEKVVKKEKPKEKEEVVEKDTYKDQNTTPIGIYKLEGNTLTKLTEVTKHLTPDEDIDVFQIYPSNENTVTLNTSFGESFYNEWIKYQNIKQGFNIKYTLKDNQTTSYNILTPDDTFAHWEYLLNYLYDDYANRGKSFYSHIENTDYNENTLYTSFKMQSTGNCGNIAKIELTAFTYDSNDDLKDNDYIGNSKSTLIINTN